MVAIVGIVSRRGLTIEGHCRNRLKKSKLALCKPSLVENATKSKGGGHFAKLK